jgi:hypothetical protein
MGHDRRCRHGARRAGVCPDIEWPALIPLARAVPRESEEDEPATNAEGGYEILGLSGRRVTFLLCDVSTQPTSQWSRSEAETDMNNNFELALMNSTDGVKGHSSALDAVKKIDLLKFLA